MKLCQPSSSQSKSTQTRPSSLGSRKTCEPLDPCCLRFSRLVVEKIFHQRSNSSTFVVAKNNSLLLWSERRGSYGIPCARGACDSMGSHRTRQCQVLHSVTCAADAGSAGVCAQTLESKDADRNHHGPRSGPDFDRFMVLKG